VRHAFFLALLLACGSESPSASPPSPAPPLPEGTVLGGPPDGRVLFVAIRGLRGSGLVLTNAGLELPVVAKVGGADQTVFFGSRFASGTSYAVAVKAQPTGPAQTCVVDGGTGTVAEADIVVAVTCTTTKHVVSGVVQKMAGSGIEIANGVEVRRLGTNGPFAFEAEDGEAYDVVVRTAPMAPRQRCTVERGRGIVRGADVGDVVVSCGYVLVAGAAETSHLADVKAKLDATNRFTRVDTINVRQAAQPGRLSPELLATYDAVLAFASGRTFYDPADVGNLLADYFDAGGRVVVATEANGSNAITGRWETGNYHLLETVGGPPPNVQSAPVILEAASPLVAGLATLRATSAIRSTGATRNGGVVVARWGDGVALVVRGEKDGRRYATLNFMPPSNAVATAFWIGDGDKLMQNALLY